MKIFMCKKCSHPLFLEEYVQAHGSIKQVFDSSQECQVFVSKPSKWMDLCGESGYIMCPKCAAKLGQYIWHGNTCSCGYLVVPYIAFVPSKLLITEMSE